MIIENYIIQKVRNLKKKRGNLIFEFWTLRKRLKEAVKYLFKIVYLTLWLLRLIIRYLLIMVFRGMIKFKIGNIL